MMARAAGVVVVVTVASAAARFARTQSPLLQLDPRGEVSGDLSGSIERSSPIALAPDSFGGGLVFNAPEDAFRASEPLALPDTYLSVDAWACVETPQRWGGLVGLVEDNAEYEKGWMLGHDEHAFTFGISTRATDDGDGRLIYLTADVPFEAGRWHHVAATYDGETARLFVDGRLAARAEEPGGPILTDDAARFVIGAYADSNEMFPLDGRISEASVHEGAWTWADVAERAAARPDLIAAAPWSDAELTWLVRPYLTWPRRDGVSVLFETTVPADARLWIAPEGPPGRDAVWSEVARDEASPTRLHEFVVRGLEPNAKYFYRATVDSTVSGSGATRLESETRSFRTAPDGAKAGVEAFTFTVIGDTQTNGAVAGRVAALAFEHRPNFVVHCGDLVDTGSTKTDWTETFFPNMRPLLEHAPLISVLGNHEQDARLYYEYMSLPEPERWYSLRYGNAEFFMLDGNRSLADLSEQLEWLEEALAESTATWRFAVLHQPPYTSDSNDYGETATGGSSRGDTNVRNIVRSLERYDVDVCFSGHVHDYERTFPILGDAVVPYEEGGIVYVTAAGGGGPLEDFDGTNTWFGHKKMRRHHFAHVAIHGDRLELQAMDEDGRLFDAFHLRKRGQK